MEMATQSRISPLLDQVKAYCPRADVGLITRAYEFAEKVHQGQKRLNGDDYIIHPLEVARILATLEADPVAVAGGLLHDTVEDGTDVTINTIKEKFGERLGIIVDGVTKLKKLDFATRREEQARNLRKMIVAMAQDLRVILIKLADRLHNMRTLYVFPEEKRRRTSEETLYIFAPLAHRLGVWKLKAELEDLCLRYLEPQAYWNILQRIGATRAALEARIEQAKGILHAKLLKAGIPAEVHGRAKNIYSIWRKMQRENLPLEQIRDIMGLRVIVHTVEQCYQALGVVHDLWRPIPGEFTDYIAMPKANRYQSLHTKVLGPDGQPMEVQIRTWEMHRVAEYGVAAHWRYKEGEADPAFDQQIEWLRSLLELGSDVAEQYEFLELLQGELLREQVFVFTPKGDVIDLPAGSTPIDFAYRIHTEIGHHCVGARVNGRPVALDYRLQTGDVVEIITSPTAEPRLEWLNIIQSSKAKAKVRRYLRAKAKHENYEAGRQALERAIEFLPPPDRERIDLDKLPDVAKRLGYPDAETLVAAIGYGDVEPSTVVRYLLELRPPKPTSLAEEVQLKLPSIEQAPGRKIETVPVVSSAGGGLRARLAQCCNPLPGDPIMGYITRGSGIAVHRADCKNLQYRAKKEPERIVPLAWSAAAQKQKFDAWVEVIAVDRVGLLSHIAAIVADAGINIAAAQGETQEPGLARLRLRLQISQRRQLDHLLDRLRLVQDVVSVRELPARQAGQAAGQ